MKATSVSFTLARSMPVQPMSGDPADQYASIRPSATVTISLDSTEGELSAAGRKIIEEAFEQAATLCFNEMASFAKELRQTYSDAAAKRAASNRRQ